MRASRTVVRPGRKDGGTALIFRLSKGAVLRVTVVRVYPSCKRLGSFTVRGHSGVNRVRFRGRLRGRPLPPGGYRLVIRAQGAQRDAAVVTIVVVNGKASKAAVRKARTASTCSEPIAHLASAAPDDSAGPAGERRAGVTDRVGESLSRVAKAVGGVTKGVTRRVADAAEDEGFLLIAVGLLLGAIALLGTVFLAYITRSLRVREEP